MSVSIDNKPSINSESHSNWPLVIPIKPLQQKAGVLPPTQLQATEVQTFLDKTLNNESPDGTACRQNDSRADVHTVIVFVVAVVFLVDVLFFEGSA